jgi:hypothetical protein
MKARQTRRIQRMLHLTTGGVLLAFVYLTPDGGSVLTDIVRWLVFPLLAATGIAMWQWPRIRRLWRRPRIAA